MALTEKMKNFCREYFTNGGNGTQAYLSAYDCNSDVTAANESSLLLKRDDIQEYLGTLNKPLEKKAISEREKKREFLWNVIMDDNQSMADRLRSMDILNKVDSEYININRNIDEQQTVIAEFDTDALKRFISHSTG